MRGWRTWIAVVATAATWFAPARARAYTVSTFLTDGCHEQLTLEALRDVRASSPDVAPPLPLAAADVALVDDLPFSLPEGAGELGAVSLVLGVRDNDLKGRGSTDLEALAQIHGDPSTQDEHCLRARDDDEPTGTARAVARCRAYILERVGAALDHLDADGAPDGTSRVGLVVSLAIRGRVTVALPGFYLHLGQALHAVQDSFSHSYRTADARAITASLTWLHPVDDDVHEAVTGPPHSSALDRCFHLDDLRARRKDVAIEASGALLAAALGPGARDQRLARVDGVLDQYLSVMPGCAADNGWCAAPERDYPTGGGCDVAAGRGRGLTLGLLVLGAALVAARRRRRLAAVAGLVALLLAPGRAAAAPGPDALTPRGESAAKPPVASKAPEARFAERSALGLVVSAGASLNHAAMNVSLGARLRLTPRWLVGLDAEWNPWASLEGDHVRAGAFNAYATVVRRWSMQSDRFDVRTTAHLGTSTVLFDLYGVPAGTTGLFAGVSLLGLEWRASRSVSIVVDPADVVYPLPQLRGAPFGYLQYRLTIGVQWGA